MKIKSVKNFEVLYETDHDTMRATITHLLSIEDKSDQSNYCRLNLAYADLSGQDLSRLDLHKTVLTCANLSRTKLVGTDLSHANLMDANFVGADFTKANLRKADFSGTNLSGAVGLPTQKEYLKNFEQTVDGIYVYKAIGVTDYYTPTYWKIVEGSYLEEVCNPNRTTGCGYGVNFATLDWIANRYRRVKNNTDIWKCLIEWEDVSDVVVPYNTDGKARCARLKLVEIVS